MKNIYLVKLPWIFLFALVIFSCKDESSKKSVDRQYNIAYNVLLNDTTDNYEVFIMDINGLNKKNLIGWDGVEWTYEAGQNEIFFISDKDTLSRHFFLYKMNPKGEDKKKVSDVRLADSWQSLRRKGDEIIIRPHRSVDSAFYILNMKGEILKRLPIDYPYFGDPLFIHNDEKIAFRAAPEAFKRNVRLRDEIFIMNADGTGIKQLTTYPKADTTAAWHSYKAGPPRWNSKDKFISYQSFQDGKYSLFGVTPDGEKLGKLTDLEWSEGWHDWSSDGQYLAIELFDAKQSQFHIGLMNWRTKELSILTDTTYTYQQAPVFVEITED